MRKFRFLFVVAIVVVFALSLSLIAGATDTATAETYEEMYVGEYTSTETPTQEGVSYDGEAYVIFGKVTGSDKAGIILERYDDSSYVNLHDAKYFGAREGRIAENGEFGIALYNVADGFYKVKVIAGDYKAPSAEGEYVTFSKGADAYNIAFVVGTNNVINTTAFAGGTVVPPEVEREGYELMGWTYSNVSATGNPNAYSASHREMSNLGTPETAPANFTNINTDRIYVAQWAWVGENGDYKAPENMTLNMAGYSKLSVKHTAIDDKVEIPAGSVAVMSFDVVEDAIVSGPSSIALLNTSSVYYAYQAFHEEATFAPIYREGAWKENSGNLWADPIETGNLMTTDALLKAGYSVKLVYKPWESDENPGWYKAYVKTASDSEYTLFAGWENMASNVATAFQMPAFYVGETSNWWRGGSLSVSLHGLQIGIDEDGDYTTTEDFTDLGIGIAGNHENFTEGATKTPITDRFVDITTFVPANEYVYEIVLPEEFRSWDGLNHGTGAYGAMSFNAVAPAKMNAEDGNKLIMQFTVVDSNIDECTSAPKFGFGMPHALMEEDFSQRHGIGVWLGWTADAEGNVGAGFDGSGDVETLVNPYAEVYSYGIGMKDLLVAGTTLKFEVALDTVNDDEHNGYIYIWYKTAEMDDFDLAVTVDYMAFNKISEIGGLPTFISYDERNPNWEFNMQVTAVSCATYDVDDNLTSRSTIILGYQNPVDLEKGEVRTNFNEVTQIYPVQ